MSDYIDLKLIEDEGEERDALLLMITQSLDEATERGVPNVVCIMRYQRLMPQGNFDQPRTVPPLKLAASASDPSRVLEQILKRIRQGVGRQFHGRLLCAIEDPENAREPLAGVWERNVSFGTEDGDQYSMGSVPQQPPPGWNNQPPGWGGMPTPQVHGPAPLVTSYQPPMGSMPMTHDPGKMGEYSPEDRELIRSVLASGERRADALMGELRARDANLFLMLDYNLKQHHQGMQLLAMLLGRWVPTAPGNGSNTEHPIASVIKGLASMFFPAPAQAPSASTPPPPQIPMPPPHVPSFHDPMGDPADLNFGAPPPVENHGPAGSAQAYRPPANEAEWTAAMQADPEGAKRAAAQLVPVAFRPLLTGK